MPSDKVEDGHSSSFPSLWWYDNFGGTGVNWQERIVFDPNVLVGKPTIKGTRMAVEFILELLAEGWSHAEILRNYTHLVPEDLTAALQYATAALKQEHYYPIPA